MLAQKQAASLPTLDFQAIFEASAGLFVVLANDFTVAAASNAYLQAMGKTREAMIGFNFFNIISDDSAEPAHSIRASLERVQHSRLPDTMAVRRQVTATADGKECERYWSLVNSPVLGSGGEIAYLLHRVDDVTDFIQFKEQDIEQLKENAALRCLTEQMEATIYAQAQEVVNANRQLNEARIFLKKIIDYVGDPIFVKDRQHRWIEGNAAMWALFGKSEHELLGRCDYDFFSREEADVFWQKDEEVFQSGKPNINIENFTDANGVTHVISTKKACFTGPNNEQILVGVIRDITDIVKMEERLKESDEARLKSIMDYSGRPVYIKDLQGRYLRVNTDLIKLIGKPEEAIIGKTDADFFGEDYADTFRRNDLKVIEKGAAIEFEEVAPHPDGPHIYISVKFPLYDANKCIYAICGISTDITERKQAEKATGLLAAIVESSDDAIISQDLNNVITSWNRGAEALFGYLAQEAIGRPVDIIVPEDKRGEMLHIFTRQQEGVRIERHETVRVARNGRRLYVSLTLSPIRDHAGGIVSYSLIMHDMSKRKAAEEQLLRYTKALERSNQELDDFAYIASHDLKEPLRGLFNHALFLKEDYAGKLDEAGLQRLDRLSQLCQHMERLVNDLLYFSRLGRTHMAVQETDLNPLLQDAMQLLDTFIRENNAQVTVKPLPHVVCDRVRITEVFRNLITNAVKYNDKPTPVVEVGFLPEMQTVRGPECNVFYVRDNGMGISAEFHEEIFRIFKRLYNPRQKEPGSGVGLTFVKKIVERHNGRVWLESEKGKGSTFYFTLGRISA